MSYFVQGFGRPLETCSGLANWSFQIELDADFARKVMRIEITNPDWKKTLHNMARKSHEAIFQDWEMDLFPRRQIYSYSSKGPLITNINVEPGQACGLDVDWSNLKEVEETDHPWPLKYLPHNLDTKDQAFALMAAWTIWYEQVYYLAVKI